MSDRKVTELHFVDDSDDEIFISRVLFERQNIDLEILHYTSFDDYQAHLEGLDDEQLAESLGVIDLNLTVSKGTDGIAALRGHSRFASMLVGVCSGSDDPADVRSAQEAGANFFVGKPVDVNCLQRICDAVPALSLVDDGERLTLMHHED